MIVSGQVRFHQDLEPLMVPIDSVKPHPQNYNRGDVEAVTESIEINGMYRPIFVQRATGFIIAGNHTWEACLSLDAEQIPVVALDVNDTEAYQIMVADNRTASLASPDTAALVNLLAHIGSNAAHGLAGTGYNADDLTVLTHLAQMHNEPLEFAQWPVISFQVHPRIRKAFMHMTREADSDPDRLELLMRLAGWDGK